MNISRDEQVDLKKLLQDFKAALLGALDYRLGSASNNKIVDCLRVVSGSLKYDLLKAKSQSGEAAVNTFGYAEVELLMTHFNIDSINEAPSTKAEMTDYKMHFQGFRSAVMATSVNISNAADMWEWFSKAPCMKSCYKIMPLVKLACIAMPTTVEAECTFSSQNIAKTPIRASMHLATISNRVRVMRLMPEVTWDNIDDVKPLVPLAWRLLKELRRLEPRGITAKPGLFNGWKAIWDSINGAEEEIVVEDDIDEGDIEVVEEEGEGDPVQFED